MAKIFTTEFSTAFEGVAAGGDKTTTGEGFASGVGVTGGGLVSAGAAKAGAIVRQKIKEPAKADVMAKTSEVRSILIGQRNSIRERKRASFFKIGDRCSRHQRCRLQEIVGRAFLPAIKHHRGRQAGALALQRSKNRTARRPSLHHLNANNLATGVEIPAATR